MLRSCFPRLQEDIHINTVSVLCLTRRGLMVRVEETDGSIVCLIHVIRPVVFITKIICSFLILIPRQFLGLTNKNVINPDRSTIVHFVANEIAVTTGGVEIQHIDLDVWFADGRRMNHFHHAIIGEMYDGLNLIVHSEHKK